MAGELSVPETDFDLDGGLIPEQYAHVPDCADTVTSKFSKGAEVLQQGAKDGGNCIPMLVRMREGKEGGGKGPLVSEDQSLTLATGNDQVLCASADLAGTLRANPGSGFRSNGTAVEGVAISGMQVRRLTPVECERLQGFPDGYTNIPWRGKPESPDGPRYKALGNSWAVPCARWIGERIKAIRP